MNKSSIKKLTLKALRLIPKVPKISFPHLLTKKDRVGIWIGPVQMQVIRWLVSFTISFLFTGAFRLLDRLLDYNLLDNWTLTGMALLLFYAIFRRDTDPVEVVPTAHAALVTWFGKPLRIYRVEGDYSWVGRILLFRRSHAVFQEITDEQGFLKVDRIQIRIWNAASEREVTAVRAVTKSGSNLLANLTLTIDLFDPFLWIRSPNPLLEVAERARSAFRTAISFFTGLDCTTIKNGLGKLMSNKTLVTCFLTEGVGKYMEGSVIRDEGGEPKYKVVEQKDGESAEDAIKRTEAELVAEMEQHGDKKMLPKVKRGDGTFIVEMREVSESLNEVLAATGARLITASIADIMLPEGLTEVAVEADRQPFEAEVQLKSARASKEARKVLKPTDAELKDPAAFADAMAIAAASDPGNKGEITFTRISGGGDVAQGAAQVARALNEKRKDKQ